MTDDSEAALRRVVKATERVERAWETRVEASDELDAAIAELNEAGTALAQAWNEREVSAG
jgi:hypothetical protein